MYKSFQNTKYYLAFNKFPKTAKISPTKGSAYITGFRKWNSDDMVTYALVLGTLRIMFGIKIQTSNRIIQNERLFKQKCYNRKCVYNVSSTCKCSTIGDKCQSYIK
jgi:hypothetical protein